MSDYNSQKNRIVWADVPVADLDRSSAFYTAVLGVKVSKESFGDFQFCVFHHEDGNGGCLVLNKGEVTASAGILVYFNVNGRIQDAVKQTEKLGGKVIEPVTSIGPHGFRAIVIDSEGNRIALHSVTDA
jgi:uncharacterized protein